MRIHSDKLTRGDIRVAARQARVSFDRFDDKGSRKRDHAFDVTLTGESRRRPNNNSGGDDYAATWDQWGVFLGRLFAIDPNMVTPYYANADDFHYRTNWRFEERITPDPVAGVSATHWPADAHGDHVFRFAGIAGQQKCTKCSAVQRWL